MLNANNPAVNLETRTFLRKLVDDEFGLDEPSLVLLEKALDRVKDISPSGWVFLLARSLGAEHDDAIEAASFAELYYAMCSFTDDVQDGDAQEYMQEVDDRILINTLAQLICVTVVRGGWLAARLGDDKTASEVSQAFLNGAVMLRGQRIEILRKDWSIESYRQVAILSGGRQFDVYFRLAALAASISPEPFLRLSDPLGILVQMHHDRESQDERLTQLSETDVEALYNDATQELRHTVPTIPDAAMAVISSMIRYACGDEMEF